VSLPLQGQCLDYFDFFRADGSGGPDGTSLRGNNCLVSSSYLSTLRIPLLRGEELPADLPSAGAPLPLLVNEAAARRFWPGQDAVGQHLRFPPSFPLRDAAVVGIVRNVRQLGLAADPPPLFYADQRIGPRLLTTLVVRTAGDPLLLTGAIRQAVHDLDPNQPIRSIETLRAVMAESIARDRFFTLLLGVFGGLALVLAAVGIYGVLAYTVTRRTNEIGVRMALGAGTADVLGSVLGGGMRLVALGIALGIAMSFGMSRVLASQLFGVTTTDPAALSSAVTILTCVGLMACLVPAWKATRISPMTALRSE
jgi:predicted permease